MSAPTIHCNILSVKREQRLSSAIPYKVICDDARSTEAICQNSGYDIALFLKWV